VKRAFALLVVLAACNQTKAPQPGARHECTCTYLTDYDDTAHVAIDACIADGKKVDDEARYCAAESAHNHIDKCECKATGVRCDARAKDACKQR
jgi:hypothetical protein